MIFRKKKREMPGLNTTSTADISFMLLIFFLVTSSMNMDKGLNRQLPAINKQEQQQPTMVEKERLLQINIEADNQILLDQEPVLITNVRQQIARFIAKAGNQHVIALILSPEADYQTYFRLQNQLVLAYQDVRNNVAKQQYKCSFRQCTATQKQTILSQWPLRIAEQYNKLQKGSAL